MTALARSIDPGAIAGRLLGALLPILLQVGLGAFVGALATSVMRRLCVHWSWAALVLAIVLASALLGPLHGWAVVCACGALLATVCGRRRHRADLEAGGEVARIAATRNHPLWALQVAARRHSLPATADPWLGVDRRGRAVAVDLGGRGGGSHTLVVGATGSGKTVTQTSIAAQAITRGMGAVIVDPKGDSSLREGVRRAALGAAVPPLYSRSAVTQAPRSSG